MGINIGSNCCGKFQIGRRCVQLDSLHEIGQNQISIAQEFQIVFRRKKLPESIGGMVRKQCCRKIRIRRLFGEKVGGKPRQERDAANNRKAFGIPGAGDCPIFVSSIGENDTGISGV